MQVIKKHDLGSTDFFWELRRFDNFDVPFYVAAYPSKPVGIWIWFNADVSHRDVTPGAIDFSMHLGIRGPVANAADFPLDPFCAYPPWIPGGVMGGNILSRTHHYGHATMTTYTEVTAPGWYRVEVWGKSRTDAMPGQNGLAELQQETNVLNQLLIRVED